MLGMKKLLCVAALALVSASAIADTQFDTKAFTLDASTGGWGGDALLSDQDGVTRFVLNGVSQYVAGQLMSSYSVGNSIAEDGVSKRSALYFDVRAGYRITGYTFSGNFVGDYYVGLAPDGRSVTRAGVADNSAGFKVDASGSPSGSVQEFNAKTVLGSTSFTLESNALSLDGRVALYLDSSAYAYARSTSYAYTPVDGMPPYWSQTPSLAAIRFQNLSMTVYTAPIAAAVPEPETYAMLLAGLAAVGVAARRRKSA